MTVKRCESSRLAVGVAAAGCAGSASSAIPKATCAQGEDRRRGGVGAERHAGRAGGRERKKLLVASGPTRHLSSAINSSGRVVPSDELSRHDLQDLYIRVDFK